MIKQMYLNKNGMKFMRRWKNSDINKCRCKFIRKINKNEK